MNPHLPTATPTSTTLPVRYAVTKASALSVQAGGSLLSPYLKEGLHVDLLNSDLEIIGFGFLIAIDVVQRTLTVHIVSLQNEAPERYLDIIYVQPRRAWSLSVPDLLVKSEAAFLLDSTAPHSPAHTATLDALCKVPSDYAGGLLSWSLLYAAPASRTRVELIQGHDYETPGTCYYARTGAQWSPGQYYLVAALYHTNANVLLARDTRTWTLQTPSSTLSCGKPQDYLSPLLLVSL